MKKSIYLTLCCFLSITILNAQKNKSYKTSTPFQGTKEYCSFIKPVKYIVSIKGNKAIITYKYKNYSNSVKGLFRNGKLYTTNPYENKMMAGRLYILTTASLRVNNLEGSDYVEYDLCK